ncbi:MAG: Isopenicillin epimerase [Verrucomicrobiota bacterium]|jgi:isopenicillin-N epimerase
MAGFVCARRRFLAASVGWGSLASLARGSFRATARRPDRDEDWSDLRAAWLDSGAVVNLENGGVQASPRVVDEVFHREWESAQRLPALRLGRDFPAALDAVRSRLAAEVGCGPDEIALVRNTTEGVHNLLQGWRLDRGDRVLTTTQDYWRFHDGLAQRAVRDGIGVDAIRLPVPLERPADVVRLFTEAVGPRTRVVLLCHVVNLTGQILPVAAIAAALRPRGVAVIVDGAHGFGHLTDRVADLGCDAYVTSLHKWIGAPHGTGFLHLRRERIERVWPLFPSPASHRGDIRKFESLGTVASAPFLGIPPALDFWREVGPSVKLARLRWLRDRWLRPAGQLPGSAVLTRTEGEGAGALATISFPGRDVRRMADELLHREDILVRPIIHAEFSGLRVTPNLFNSAADLDRLTAALGRMLG